MSTAPATRRAPWLLTGAVAMLFFFVAVAAIPAGLMLVVDPTGGFLGLDVAALKGGPFPDYFVPGVFLFLVNGVGSLVAGVATLRRWRLAPHAAVLLGGLLTGWIIVQVGILGVSVALQPVFLFVGLAELMLGIVWWLRYGDGPRWQMHGAVAVLCGVVGLTATAGGIELVAWPNGASWMPVHPAILDGTPFGNFLVPGLLLLLFVGLVNLAAGVLVLRRSRYAPVAAVFAAGAICVYILAEMAMLQTHDLIEAVYLALGALIAAAAAWIWARQNKSYAGGTHA